MAEFPIEAFLRTYQQKYANDQAAQERGPAASFGRGLQTGINTQFALETENQSLRQKALYTMITRLQDNYDWRDKYDPNRNLSPEEILMNYKGLLSGHPPKNYELVAKQTADRSYTYDPETGEYKEIPGFSSRDKYVRPYKEPETATPKPTSWIRLMDGTFQNPETGEISNTVPQGTPWKQGAATLKDKQSMESIKTKAYEHKRNLVAKDSTAQDLKRQKDAKLVDYRAFMDEYKITNSEDALLQAQAAREEAVSIGNQLDGYMSKKYPGYEMQEFEVSTSTKPGGLFGIGKKVEKTVTPISQVKQAQPTTPPASPVTQPTTPQGRIRVKQKATGLTGTIDVNEFDPTKYERL